MIQYPLEFIFKTISQRLKYHINNKDITKKRKTVDTNKKLLWFIIPYVNKISDKFKKMINSTVSKIAFYNVKL